MMAIVMTRALVLVIAATVLAGCKDRDDGPPPEKLPVPAREPADASRPVVWPPASAGDAGPGDAAVRSPDTMAPPAPADAGAPPAP